MCQTILPTPSRCATCMSNLPDTCPTITQTKQHPAGSHATVHNLGLWRAGVGSHLPYLQPAGQ